MEALRLEELDYSYDNYVTWSGEWELFDGLPVAMSPAPMINHQMLAAEMSRIIGNALEECTSCAVASEVDYKVNNNTILRPDVVLFCEDPYKAYLSKAPEMIVEVISPSTAKRDEVYKFDIYQTEKVKYYIIIYPDDLIAKVYKLDGKVYDKQGDFSEKIYHFEDLKCPLSIDFERVFARFH